MNNMYLAQRHALAQAANRTAGFGYVTSQGGNLSTCVDEDIILITPTQVAKRDIQPDDIVIINMQGETLWAKAGRRPTSESPFHRRIYTLRPDVKALIHAHPPLLTAFALTHSKELEAPYLPEPIMEVGPMLTVPYALPGSQALARAFETVLPKANAFLMANHGVLMTSSEGIDRALDLLELMEGAAQSILSAKVLGPLIPLADEDLDALQGAMLARGLPLPGAPGTYQSLKDVYNT